MPNSIGGKITNGNTSVTSTATPIPSTAATGRRVIMVYNNGSATAYLGNANVTISNGYPLENGGEKSFDLNPGVILYGITASGTADIRSLEGT